MPSCRCCRRQSSNSLARHICGSVESPIFSQNGSISTPLFYLLLYHNLVFIATPVISTLRIFRWTLVSNFCNRQQLERCHTRAAPARIATVSRCHNPLYPTDNLSNRQEFAVLPLWLQRLESLHLCKSFRNDSRHKKSLECCLESPAANCQRQPSTATMVQAVTSSTALKAVTMVYGWK